MTAHALHGHATRPTRPEAHAGRAWRVALLVVIAVVGLVWALSGVSAQNPDYHHFVDTRVVAGVRNGVNVLTNAAFVVAGVLGLLRLRRSPPAEGSGRASFAVFFVAVALTSLGSAWYHLDPTDQRLVWDRLPMAVGFMSLLSALVGERIDRRAGAALLAPLVAAGIASVAWWAWSGNLRPYLLVQFYPLVALPLVLVLFPDHRARTWPYLVAIAAYVVAKVAEVEDRAVFDALGVVSGHGLKHLLAALGVGALAWAPRPAAD